MFAMGSDDFYPEEHPVHRVSVDGFWMDATPVTAAQFRRFVRETAYVTVAERPLEASLYPDADPELLVPGSIVFRMTSGPVDLDDNRNWWEYVPGAFWKRPGGKGTTINGRDSTRSSRSPTRTPRPTRPGRAKNYRARPSGSTPRAAASTVRYLPGATSTFRTAKPMANTWQGEFPWQNLKLDGYEGTSPVGSFPPNGYGLFDVTGNIWEWTSDWFTPHPDEVESPCCVARNPRVTSLEAQSAETIPRRVIKGGSYLCAPNYCLRYRPAARQGQPIDSSTHAPRFPLHRARGDSTINTTRTEGSGMPLLRNRGGSSGTHTRCERRCSRSATTSGSRPTAAKERSR